MIHGSRADDGRGCMAGTATLRLPEGEAWAR